MLLLNSSRAAVVRPFRAPAPRRATELAPSVSIPRPRAKRPPLLTRAVAEGDDADGDGDESDKVASASSAIPSSSTPTFSSSSTPTSSSSSSVSAPDFFTPPDEETAWLTQFLPFSRLSLDAATWLAANAERETLSPGQKVLVPGAFFFFLFLPFCRSD